jgi:hypothetical protein
LARRQKTFAGSRFSFRDCRLDPDGTPAACEVDLADYALAAAASSQMLFCRVSGIKNKPSTKTIAGTAIG